MFCVFFGKINYNQNTIWKADRVYNHSKNWKRAHKKNNYLKKNQSEALRCIIYAYFDKLTKKETEIIKETLYNLQSISISFLNVMFITNTVIFSLT